MKIQSLVLRLILTFTIGIALIVMVMMIFSGCTNNRSGAIGTLQLQADTPKSFLRAENLAAIGGAITLKSVQVEIKNLRIVRNSVPKNQNNNESGDSGIHFGIDEKIGLGNMADSLLTGPYLLNILSGTASIDEVPIQTGIYKKFEFEYFAGPDNNNHSIALSGTFTNAQGVPVPFTLTSEFSEIIHLPLVGRGLKVNSGNIISLTILFDVSKWLHKLDFNTANQTNGEIFITKDENRDLYNVFLAQVSKHIDIEKELLND
jgi:hypothetical protein